MPSLTVRLYNVGFGDAILITVPERERPRNLLIDVGNVAAGPAGRDTVFGAVVDDIREVLDGHPVDLYVMTHEHLDHVQGLPYAAKVLNKSIPVDYAWLTASAAKDYYDSHGDAKRDRDLALAAYDAIVAALPATRAFHASPLGIMAANNDPRNTGDCVAYLRSLARKRTTYVYRGCSLEGTHPFTEARFQIWGPEEDTSEYYGRFRPLSLRALAGGKGRGGPEALPSPGVDASAFYALVARRSTLFVDDLLAIDQAANNTSVVFSLEWGGRTLLFPGDAELRSWRTMNKRGVLRPVDFLKVSHHGSENGTPPPELLDRILPKGAWKRDAAVSTHPGAWPGVVPDEETLREVARRSRLKRTTKVRPGKPLKIEIRSK